MSPAHLLLLGLIGVAGAAGGAASHGIGASLLLFVCLLALSGFFSSSETAIFGLQAYDIEVLRERGSSGRLLERLRSQPQRLLATILMGNELVNVTLSSIAAALLASMFPRQPWLNVVLVVPLLLLFGEVMPKSIAIRFCRHWALAVSRPLHVVFLVLTPLRWLVYHIAGAITLVFGVKRGSPREGLREEELRSLVDLGLEQGTLKAAEQEMIHAVFEFDDLPVGRIMTPRADLVTLDLRTPWSEMLAAVRENGLSRIPVFLNDRDNIVGILMTKDLLRFLGRSPPNLREVRQILHPPYYVPIFKRADELLEEFRTQHVHMALVVDEHGSTAGLVTLDDLLGELLGELQDESDDGSEEDVRLDPDGSMLVDGAMDIEDFSEHAGCQVPEGDYSTVGGFFLSLTRALPEAGQQASWSGLNFEVVGVTGRRIATVRVRRPAAPAPATPPEEPTP